jgi:hypothetical protein
MTAPASPPSTGLPDLDRVLGGLRPGDNVVWQVESMDDYVRLVGPLVDRALAEGRRVVYFRFARHAPLVPDGRGVELHRIAPAVGFESFTSSIHRVIEAQGRGATYVFDCLSDLAADWYSDLMLGNFFMVTCPYLYELETLTYFALQRGAHSHGAVSAIRSTTQLLVDVFRHGRATCVHPLKVLGRHSPTMYLPHVWEGAAFRPLTESAVVAEALAAASERRLDPLAGLDVWDRRILHAREVAEGVRSGRRPWEEQREVVAGLVRMMLSRDERFAAMAEEHLDIDALLAVRRRTIGTGLVGGKAAGMLLARAILAARDPAWRRRLEPHDSWFIGSDVFYTYLVRNGLWRSRRRGRRGRAAFLEGAAEVRARILEGQFPDFVLGQFVTMLESYGQSPIIVRSSSLLEDGFGNAFTGKYESVFCPNQGDPDERLGAFLAAVRTVYASTMSEEALHYRDDRGLLDRDEQMAVLVQRVSGAVHGRLFYPQVAGVALSYNPYVWNAGIDPDAGVVRLVFGLGTRAVDRADDDYTRIVALNAPRLRPEGSLEGAAEHAQRRVDVIDLESNRFASMEADDVLRQSPALPVELFATRRRGGEGWTLGFEGLLWGTPLVGELRGLLATLRDAYRYPVDVEFTANHLAGGELRVNLVQCRPLQVKEGGRIVPPPRDLDAEAIVLSSRGPVIGRSTLAPVDRVIFVDPDAYAQLGTQDRHEVARVVGRLTRAERDRNLRILLLGPGRWGTTTPSLGVPVHFAEIRAVSAICEVMSIGNVIPDVSLGSHFFNDLVEADMLYLAIHPTYPGYRLDAARLRAAPNRLAEIVPDDAGMAGVVRVVDFPLAGDGRMLWLNASCVGQEVLAYLRAPGAPGADAGGA